MALNVINRVSVGIPSVFQTYNLDGNDLHFKNCTIRKLYFVEALYGLKYFNDFTLYRNA